MRRTVPPGPRHGRNNVRAAPGANRQSAASCSRRTAGHDEAIAQLEEALLGDSRAALLFLQHVKAVEV